MPSMIKLKRRLTGAVAAPPASVAANEGEPIFCGPGFTGGGPNSLSIDTGTAIVTLVDSSRQVEVTGDQSVAGVKTITGTVALTGIANLTAGDGTAGQIMTKGAGNVLTWAAAPASSVTTDPSLTGDGTVATPLSVAQATQVQKGGGMISTAALITAGADDATIISPLGLRSVSGDLATLVTTAKNALVPAINEIYNAIAALTGVIIYAGSYDATTSTGVFNGQGGIPAGTTPLPASAAANHGAYVIVTVGGPGGVAPEPAGPIAVGDWLISDGTAWTRLAFNQAALTAANVAVNPAVAGATDVQAALTAIHTLAIAPVLTVAATFSGDGVTTPLDLILVDGGTF